MAIYKAGPAGSFKGKLGELVLTKWKKLLVGRSAPGKATKPPTAEQEGQRLKFSLVSRFLTANRNAVDIGFQSAGRKMTPLNYATRYHLSRIVIGAYPAYTLDYSKIKLTLPNSVDQIAHGQIVNMDVQVDGKLMVTWKGIEFPNGCTMHDDFVYLLFYDAARQQSLFIERAAQRDELFTIIVFPAAYQNIEIQAYLFFVSDNGKLVSATQYLGSFFLKNTKRQ